MLKNLIAWSVHNRILAPDCVIEERHVLHLACQIRAGAHHARHQVALCCPHVPANDKLIVGRRRKDDVWIRQIDDQKAARQKRSLDLLQSQHLIGPRQQV